MTEVVGVKYDETSDLVYVLPDRAYQKSDLIVVKNRKGDRLAQVVLENQDLAEQKLPAEMDKVLRPATSTDVQAYHENVTLAENSFEIVQDMIADHQLKMKLVDIVFPLDRSHVLITFFAEERVDFRQLLKDLAAHFRTRIELRQINSREEAKIYGGLGPCGRALCCSSFLGEFPPVSIKMAKNQGLSLNSGKTTGICGRLMCCLSFEDEFYSEARKKFPDLGAEIETKDGVGIVAGIDVFAETLKIRYFDRSTLLTYPLEEVNVHG